jgi:hypothetical protein
VQNYAANATQWVWRHSWEAYDPKYVIPKASVRPDISIMVWAGVWITGRTNLVIMTRDVGSKKRGFSAQSYIQALEEGLLLIYDGTRHFQQDNAPIHRSRKVEAWLLRQRISYIDWPPYSPDLNPIEHVWSLLKARLHSMFPELFILRKNNADIAEFTECLQKAWAAITQDEIRAIIESLPRRLRAVRDAGGWYTKY